MLGTLFLLRLEHPYIVRKLKKSLDMDGLTLHAEKTGCSSKPKCFSTANYILSQKLDCSALHHLIAKWTSLSYPSFDHWVWMTVSHDVHDITGHEWLCHMMYMTSLGMGSCVMWCTTCHNKGQQLLNHYTHLGRFSWQGEASGEGRILPSTANLRRKTFRHYWWEMVFS